MFRFLLIISCFIASPTIAQDITGVPRVIDGDTIDIRGTRIRLFGLDAPEKSQTCKEGNKAWPCGKVATEALTAMISENETQCWKTDADRYGRMVAVCMSGDKYLNATMVSDGHAVAYVRYSKAFVPLEAVARKKHRGLWKGEFDLPWDWRRAKRSAAPRQNNEIAKSNIGGAQNGCKIKGNISGSGRIYHMPGGAYYERTKIDKPKGERWFCSEEEARRAGWRRSKR
jgi:endonuclease YncB( thermonuclease family)